ncbi:MAG TPA: hypothetical protein VGY54_04430 [Polyangiaceae bacterium]|jgi:hypothetical protein|nr:hypothetical protein [Polyangiaceae bacterium]
MVSWGAAYRALAALTSASLGTLAAGCSSLLGITDITPAPADASDATSASDDAATGPEATNVGSDASVIDVSESGTLAGDGSPSDQSSSTDSSSDIATGDSLAHESGASEGGDANGCPQDLSGTATRDFSISFTLQTTQPSSNIALLNQRRECNVGEFWDIRLYNQILYVEISDVAQGGIVITGPSPGDSANMAVALNDGKPHDIVVSRVAGEASLTVDGALAGSSSSFQSFGKGLPALKVGRDVCEGFNGTVPLVQGTIGNICVKPL